MVGSGTYSAKVGDVASKWVLIDDEGLVLGRVAALLATLLRGKHRPQYTPHINCGDDVVVINDEKFARDRRTSSDYSQSYSPPK